MDMSVFKAVLATWLYELTEILLIVLLYPVRVLLRLIRGRT